MWKWLSAVDRYSRWALALVVLIFVITGLAITKGFMDPRLAKELHENILPPLFYILVILHVFYSLPSHLLRWKIFESERVAGFYSATAGFLLLALFFWLHYR